MNPGSPAGETLPRFSPADLGRPPLLFFFSCVAAPSLPILEVTGFSFPVPPLPAPFYRKRESHSTSHGDIYLTLEELPLLLLLFFFCFERSSSFPFLFLNEDSRLPLSPFSVGRNSRVFSVFAPDVCGASFGTAITDRCLCAKVDESPPPRAPPPRPRFPFPSRSFCSPGAALFFFRTGAA